MPFVVPIEDVVPPERFDSVPWNRARIEQSTKYDGPWTVLATEALSPLDSDPSDPATRSFTTNAATLEEGWFRVVWLDASDAERAGDPVHYPPLDGPISLEEFKKYVNVTSDAKDALLQSMLNSGFGSVARLTSRQLLDLGTVTVTRRIGPGGFVWIPDARTVSKVKAGTDTLTIDEWVPYGNEDGPTITAIEIIATDAAVAYVTGEFGLVPLPDELRALVLAAAARHYYRRAAGFADTIESNEYGLQSFFRSLPADMQANAEAWTIRRPLAA